MNRPVGVFGGTFDPVHFGHLRPALELLESLDLAEVRLIPCRMPPHRTAPMADPEQRLAMLELAVDDQPGLVVDRRELARPGPSYMVDTLSSLRAEVGDTPLCLLLGLDAFLGLAGWHRWRELPDLAHIVVTHRPGWSLEGAGQAGAGEVLELLHQRLVAQPGDLARQPAGGVWLQPVTQLDISASTIRKLVGDGGSPRYLLPDVVWCFIRREGLYRRSTNRNGD